LEDPSLTSSIEGIKVFGRQGKVIGLEIPITQTGDFSGTLFIDKVATSGVKIELISNGEVVATIHSSFDGYFYAQKIKPAQYLLRVKGMKNKPVNITSEGLELDLYLTKEEDK
jgi:hypothetical protein